MKTLIGTHLNSTILQLLWCRKENSSEKVAQGEILSLVWSSRFLCDAMLCTYSREKIQVMLDWLTKGSLSMLVTVARASKAFVPLKKKTGEKGVRNLLYSISRALRKNKPSYHLIIVIDWKEWCQSMLVKVNKIRFYVKSYDVT